MTNAATESIRPLPRGVAHGVTSVLFFLSGATGLAYEVIWFTRFSHVWGSSTLAMGAVVGSFLLGLGVGAQLLGTKADRVSHPLRWYGLFEIGIALCALVIPFVVAWVGGIVPSVYSQLHDSAIPYFLLRAVITFLVIGPPCILMGGTLPLLVRQCALLWPERHEFAAWPYAVNTLGAATGCYATGFHILPSVGLSWTNGCAAALNAAIGVAAVWMSRHVSAAHPSVPAVSPASTARTTLWARAPFCLAAALGGCAALIIQMIWARQLALILGGSTFAFTATVLIALIGIGIGSALFHFWSGKYQVSVPVMAPVIVCIAAFAVAGNRLIPELSNIAGVIRPLRESQFLNAACFLLIGSVLQLIPSVAMGVFFPSLVQLLRQVEPGAGRAVGSIYAWNTFGSITGALITSSFLVPAIGISKSLSCAIGLYFIALAVLARPRRWQASVPLVSAAAVAILLVWWSNRDADPRFTNTGAYLYGPRDGSTLEVLFFQEGMTANVLVTEDRNSSRSLRVNGKADASDTDSDMRMQLALAYFPRFLHPHANETLVIGFGSGTTSGASLEFAGTRVTCCEIESAVLEASKYFRHVNHHPESSPQFSTVVDDGRHFLQASKTQYDLILSEPSNPWMAGVSNLFTREFYLAVEQRLSSGGMLAQWIQSYSLTPSDYTMVLRTVQSVFPHARLFWVSHGDTILVASGSPITIDDDRLAQLQSTIDSLPRVTTDLQRYFSTSDVRSVLLRHLFLDGSGIDQLASLQGQTHINTDSNMRLEFDAASHLFAEVSAEEAVIKAILAACRRTPFEANFFQWGCSIGQLAALQELTEFFAANGERTLVDRLSKLGSQVAPDNHYFAATRLLVSPPRDLAQLRTLLARMAVASPDDANRVGMSFWQAQNFSGAIVAFEELAEVWPDSSSVWANLGVAYSSAGRRDEARTAFEKSHLLDPLNETAKEAYDWFHSQPPPRDADR